MKMGTGGERVKNFDLCGQGKASAYKFFHCERG